MQGGEKAVVSAAYTVPIHKLGNVQVPVLGISSAVPAEGRDLARQLGGMFLQCDCSCSEIVPTVRLFLQ